MLNSQLRVVPLVIINTTLTYDPASIVNPNGEEAVEIMAGLSQSDTTLYAWVNRGDYVGQRLIITRVERPWNGPDIPEGQVWDECPIVIMGRRAEPNSPDWVATCARYPKGDGTWTPDHITFNPFSDGTYIDFGVISLEWDGYEWAVLYQFQPDGFVS